MATYIGKRIVPVHCGKWDQEKSYEMLSIVLEENSGDSYIARRMVPAGTDISDTYYWMLHSLFSQQIKDMSDQLTATEERIAADNDETEASIKADNRDTRDHVDQSIQQTTRELTELVTNARTAMTQQKNSFDASERQLNARMDAVLAAGTGDGETEILDARVDADGIVHESLGSAIRSSYQGLKERAEDVLNEQLFPMLGLVWHDGGFVDLSGGISMTQNIYAYTDYILCNEGETIKVCCATKHTGMCGIAFYNINHVFISGVFNDVDDYTEKELVTPANTAFCRLSAHISRKADAYIKWENGVIPNWLIAFNEKHNDGRISNLENMIGMHWEPGYISKGGNVSDADQSRFHSDFIPCSPGATVAYVGESNHVNVSVISFYDRNGGFISGLQNTGTKGEEQTAVAPDNAWFLRISTDKWTLQNSYARVSSPALSLQVMDMQKDIDRIEAADNNQYAPSLAEAGGYYYQDGYYVSTLGVESKSAGRMLTGFIPCPEGATIRFMAETNHERVGALCFYDMNHNFISAVSNIGDMDAEYEAIAPSGTWFVRSSADKYHQHYVRIMDALGGTVQRILETANFRDLFPVYARELTTENLMDVATKSNKSACEEVSGGYTINPGGWYFPSLDVYRYSNNEKNLTIALYCEDEILPTQITLCPSTSPSTRVGSTIRMDKIGSWYIKTLEKSVFDEEHRYLILACDGRGKENAFTVKDISISEGIYASISGTEEQVQPEPMDQRSPVTYVSVDGKDTNDGTATSPFATVNKALASGATNILMYAGTYRQKIDLAKSDAQIISIGPVKETGRVIFEGEESLICTEETLVDGYEHVYCASVDKVFPTNMKWIFHDGVVEVTTLITDEERHPLERGMKYRCEDTRIIRCSASAVENALTEIESASAYKWYYDAENKVLYFSRPQPVTEENPLKSNFGGEALFANALRHKTLLVTGIETRYMCFNVNFTIGSRIIDCKAANVVAAGAFTYNRSVGAEFVRCEACHCNTGSNGDGFNGHSANSGDPFSKQTAVSLIDCWSHDNQDDGYSDHERSEITIIGGLYEWNGKGGVVPSYGSHCTCYNVMARHNYNGFYYTGTAEEAEGGMYGQCVCIGCIAENNTAGSTMTGFKVDGNGNRMMCIDCRSMNNALGFAPGNSAYMKLIDCHASGNTTAVKGGTVDHIAVENTDLVN